jgi:AcrR family transcriptional regulator
MVDGNESEPEARRPAEGRESVRDRILAAAMAVARESGAGRLSLDAIARRAGVSKGGLLYHFPKKDALMRALVERHLAEIEAATFEGTNAPGRPNAVAQAFIGAYRAKLACEPAPPSGVLAALAENPHLLEPVRAHQVRIVDRLRSSASDIDLSLIAFLAVEGMKALELFETDPLTGEERERVFDALLQRLERS